jgi:hypothetical protein
VTWKSCHGRVLADVSAMLIEQLELLVPKLSEKEFHYAH